MRLCGTGRLTSTELISANFLEKLLKFRGLFKDEECEPQILITQGTMQKS